MGGVGEETITPEQWPPVRAMRRLVAQRGAASAARELRALHIRVLARHRGSGICTHCLASGGEVLDCLPQPLELHYPSLLRVTPPHPASPASSSPRNLWNLH